LEVVPWRVVVPLGRWCLDVWWSHLEVVPWRVVVPLGGGALMLNLELLLRNPHGFKRVPKTRKIIEPKYLEFKTTIAPISYIAINFFSCIMQATGGIPVSLFLQDIFLFHHLSVLTPTTFVNLPLALQQVFRNSKHLYKQN